MPNIVLPNTFSATAVLDADLIMENLHSPAALADSLDVINGQLDIDNWTNGNFVTREMIQPETFSWCGSVGTTANRDYFSDWFTVAGSVDLYPDATEASYVDQYVALVNLGRTFLLRDVPRFVYLSWGYYSSNDGDYDASAPGTGTNSSHIKLFVDGESAGYEHTRRSCPPSVNTDTPSGSGGEIEDIRYSHKAARWITGHAFISGTLFTRGWHTAQLKILHNCRQARVNAGYFNVLVAY